MNAPFSVLTQEKKPSQPQVKRYMNITSVKLKYRHFPQRLT